MDQAASGAGIGLRLGDVTRIPNDHAVVIDGEDVKNFLSDHIEAYYETKKVRFSIAYFGGSFRLKAFSRCNPSLATIIESCHQVIDSNTTIADFSARIREMNRDILNRSTIAEVMEA
jgi:hypothetical protein